MSSRFAILAAVFLAGCGPVGTSLVSVQASCTAADASFPSSWGCIKAKIAAGQAGLTNNAQAVRYQAVGDYLAELVRTRKMTDNQAKAQLAIELDRDDSEFQRRALAAQAGGPIICNRFGATTVCN